MSTDFSGLETKGRSSAEITLSVWRALFFREALTRLFGARFAWFWLLVEPVFHVSYLLFIFTVVRVHSVGGIDTAMWLMIGMLAFFTFQRTAVQTMNAVSANKALFAYRQVKPVDTVLVRAALEALLMVIVSVVLLTGLALLGHHIVPADPLEVLVSFFGLWLLGLALGLIGSVASDLAPELGRLIHLAMMPMFIISGAMFPVASVPQPYRDWLMLNPVAHGLEAVRLGFVPHYHAVPELSEPYLHGVALAGLFLGLALQRRFALRLMTE